MKTEDTLKSMPPFGEVKYVSLVKSLIDKGYKVTPYNVVHPDQPHLVLRHDIDMSLQAAVRIATLEAQYGWKSYYFIMVRSFLYSIFTPESQGLINQLTSLGHSIGLHFDPHPYEGWDDMNVSAAQETAFLSNITGKPIEIISFHRPSKSLLGNARNLAGLPHTYQPRFFQDIAYCSDSRGAWYHGHPFEHISVKEGKALQLLTHPIWWDGTERSPEERLRDYVQNHVEKFKSTLSENCSIYKYKHENLAGES